MSKDSKKQPKTVKLSTLIVVIGVVIGFVASFVAGAMYANHYNKTVETRAIELASKIKSKNQ